MNDQKLCRCEYEEDGLRVTKDATYCWGCDTLGFDGRLWIPAGEVAALQSRIEELEANISTLAVAIGVEGAGSELTVEHAIARIGRLQSSNAELLAFMEKVRDAKFTVRIGYVPEEGETIEVYNYLSPEAQRLIKEQK